MPQSTTWLGRLVELTLGSHRGLTEIEISPVNDVHKISHAPGFRAEAVI